MKITKKDLKQITRILRSFDREDWITICNKLQNDGDSRPILTIMATKSISQYIEDLILAENKIHDTSMDFCCGHHTLLKIVKKLENKYP